MRQHSQNQSPTLSKILSPYGPVIHHRSQHPFLVNGKAADPGNLATPEIPVTPSELTIKQRNRQKVQYTPYS